MSANEGSIIGMCEKYHVEIKCLECGSQYVTRLINRTHPKHCKNCLSTKIIPINKWKVDW